MTNTYAFVDVSPRCFNEIKDKLIEADYFQAFLQYDKKGRVTVINMSELALRVEQESDDESAVSTYRGE